MRLRWLGWLSGGMVLGAASGAVRGWPEIRAHDYLADGMTTLALLAIERDWLAGSALGGLIGLVAGVAVGRRRAARPAAGRRALPVVALALAVALVAAVPLRLARVRAAARERPNVLFVLVDALRADGLGSYRAESPGRAPSRTPALDRLSASGLRFAHAYSAAPKTVPSVASLFTGTLPVVHDVFEPPEAEGGRPGEGGGLAWLADRLLLAPEVFRDAGYRTAMITTTGWITPEVNYDQGVDDYRITGRADEEVIAAAESFVADAARRGPPFFAYVHLLDLHDYYHAERLFAGASGRPPAISDALWALRASRPSEIYRLLRAEPERFSAADVAFLRAAYDRELERTDAFVARLVAALERAGVAARTLVVVTGDHGEQFGEHGRLVHGGSALYDEVLRVPLVVAGPPLGSSPRVVEEPIGGIDVFPTLFELAGIGKPAVFAGRSLVAPPGSEPNPVLATDGTTWKLIAGGWSYIFSERRDREELYRLADDPAETRNLVAERSGTARELRRALGERIRAGLRHPYAALEPEARVEMDARVEETLRSLGYLN